MFKFSALNVQLDYFLNWYTARDIQEHLNSFAKLWVIIDFCKGVLYGWFLIILYFGFYSLSFVAENTPEIKNAWVLSLVTLMACQFTCICILFPDKCVVQELPYMNSVVDRSAVLLEINIIETVIMHLQSQNKVNLQHLQVLFSCCMYI